MDEETISAYDKASAQYAQDWREQPPPDDMYALLQRYFAPGPTTDVGCGSGRDVAWLAAKGYGASGRLYAAFDRSLVMEGLGSGVSVLFDQEDVSASSGKVVHRLVVRT